MMTNDPIRVEPSLLFRRAFKRLRKKYRQIDNDLKPLISQLEHGLTPGEQIQGVGHTVYKVRIQNSDAQRGKSGGYRVIYYIKTRDFVILTYIYSKSDREDITADELRQYIHDIEQE
jgi:mRNA-degrading endonuclease RelE of RelBE toxin-antitoxin system